MRMKKMLDWQKIMKHVIVLLCAVVISFGVSAPVTYAANGTADLTVTWKDAGQDIVLYRVCDRNPNGTYTYTDDFKDYGVDIFGLSQKELESNVELLAAYAVRDNLTPLDSFISDDSGKHVFSDLEYGAYLVFNKDTVDGLKVSIVPIFVFLEKDMEVVMKPLDETFTSCKVYKIWSDNDSDDRPDEIEVQLLDADGTVVDEQTLSDDNNWYYEWTDLKEGKYKIVEKSVPSGYKLSLSRSKNTWKLTNKKGNPPKPTPKKNKKIPQTGQLWWPVPVLLSAGFLCLIVGLLRRRKKETDC